MTPAISRQAEKADTDYSMGETNGCILGDEPMLSGNFWSLEVYSF